MDPKNMFANLGSMLASTMFLWAVFQQYFPTHHIRGQIDKYFQRAFNFFYLYVQVTFNEHTGERFMRSEAYSAIENYLSITSSTQAKWLKADIGRNNQSLVLSMDNYEEVADEFGGLRLWWAFGKTVSRTEAFSFFSSTDEKR
ncbi:hypothetical protein CRG98_041284 [Punica granatum]|uniref:AAA-type ATPase N-terminal domain-containing protein n=1 Tax=Punica granatum TaxID=22663 RepID=A0A2I0I4F7_PUNGR|nr:hypothetical protein CRG98_041284 [Punica granatum]